MTCIVAIKDDGKLYFGADSLLSDSESDLAIPMRSPKIFRNGPFIFGYCGSVRAGKVFQYDLPLPEPDLQNLDKYMNKELITALMDCADRNKLVIDEKDEHNDVADLIVGINGRIFEVQSHVQSVEHYEDYISLGSGSKFALGSLYTTRDFDITPKERVKLALESAAKYAMSVNKPFNYIVG
jgi:ATP-dependent protease HslVU (ClpYQ) peptidase subunit